MSRDELVVAFAEALLSKLPHPRLFRRWLWRYPSAEEVAKKAGEYADAVLKEIRD